MIKYFWLRVSPDRYELPEAVADSLSDLARLCGVLPSAIYHCIRRVELGERDRSIYVRVPDPGEEEV